MASGPLANSYHVSEILRLEISSCFLKIKSRFRILGCRGCSDAAKTTTNPISMSTSSCQLVYYQHLLDEWIIVCVRLFQRGVRRNVSVICDSRRLPMCGLLASRCGKCLAMGFNRGRLWLANRYWKRLMNLISSGWSRRNAVRRIIMHLCSSVGLTIRTSGRYLLNFLLSCQR